VQRESFEFFHEAQCGSAPLCVLFLLTAFGVSVFVSVMHDVASFERLGLPSVALLTDKFLNQATYQVCAV
jgi:hypothetical protein